MKNKEYNKWYLVLAIFAIVSMFFGGSLAYWQWTTNTAQRTNIVLTVEPTFMCEADGGGSISSGEKYLVPTDCTNSEYAIQREIKVTPTIYGEYAITMDLWLDIKSIGSGLSNSNNFKYALTTDPNSCTSGLVKSGNFKGKKANDKVELFNYMGYNTSTTDTFYLYVWLDKEETNPNTMNQNFSLSLNGMCTDAPEPETYVVFNEEDTTLRLYKRNEDTSQVSNDNIDSKNNISRLDNNIERIEDLTITDKIYFDLENTTYSNASQLPWYEYRESITRVIFEDEIKPISTAYWFRDLKNVEYIDVSNLNTSRVTNMKYMFTDAGYNIIGSFEIIGLENWNISSVVDMTDIFARSGYNATIWNIGNLSNWDTSNVTNMTGMFKDAGRNASVWNIGDLSSWDTSNVQHMTYLFGGAGINSLIFDVGNLGIWDTSKVSSMLGMFMGAAKNSTIFNIGDLSEWDVSNVTSMWWMFSGAVANAAIFDIGDLSEWDVSSVTNMSAVFEEVGVNATIWNIGDLSNWDVSSVTNMYVMFKKAGYSATTWSIGDLSGWDVSNVTNMSQMFMSTGNQSITYNIGDLSSWDVSKVTDMYRMFLGAGQNATDWSLNLSGWNVGLVTSYSEFNKGVTDKITSPIWNTSS